MITKTLHLALKKEIKNNHFITKHTKKSFLKTLKVQKKLLLKVKNNSKWSRFII